MKIQAALAALAILLAPSIAYGQAGTADAQCQALIANGQAPRAPAMILLGDSILRGAALGKFEDGDDPLDPAHPLYALRTPAVTANWALSANGRAERVAYCGAASVSNIQARISQGAIRSGDFVVIEDAGQVAIGTSSYYSTVLWPARVAAAQSGVTVIMLTMWDYPENGNMAAQYPSMQFDLVRTGGASDAGTLNDVIRRAATVTATPSTASGSGLPGKTLLIDMNWVMDSWRASALSLDGVDPMRRETGVDGVHGGVWADMRLLRELLGIAGWRQWITTTTPIEDLAAANYVYLGYGSTDPDWTANRARSYVVANLRAP